MLGVLGLSAAQSTPAPSQAPPTAPPSPPSQAAQVDALFTGPVPTFDIRIEPAYADRLRRAPRTDVPATVRITTQTPPKDRASVAAGVPPAVEGGVSPPGIPGPSPVSKAISNRSLPKDRAPVAAGVPPAVEGGVSPSGIPGPSPVSGSISNKLLSRVGIHLKGAAGSFRDFDDLPALTLDFDEFVPGQEFSGLTKLHLNNSVQDPSRLSESIASRLYLESGVPTARAGHAFVRLNGRNLGLYVMKEGYDGRFLRRHFPVQGRPLGNLYDGGFLRDIDEDLERDTGKGPEDRSDLRQLQRAASKPVAQRTAALGAVLDIDRFLALLAIQSLTDDWDGYARNRNNYRVYFDTKTGRAVFIPHGMDQLFNNPGVPVLPDWGGFIARQVMEVPEWRTRYDQRLRDLVERQFTMAWVTNHIATLEARLLPAFPDREPTELEEWSREVRRQSNRIAARLRSVRRQLELPPDPDVPSVVRRSIQPRLLDGWTPRPQQGAARLQRTATPQQALHLVALQRGTAASFRTSRNLPAGSYRFEAKARTAAVSAPDEGPPGRGVGIRISGLSRETFLVGNTPWTPLQFDFELDEDREVEFVIEIRADRGEAWFDLSSLKLSGR